MKEEIKAEIKKERKEKKEKKQLSRGARNIGYIVSIAVNIILIYIFNNLLNWHINFINESFISPLWVLNISFAAIILANIFYLIYDGMWFRSLCQVILNIISAAAIYTLYIVFPFNLDEPAAGNIRFVLIVFLVGIGIAIIVELIKFIYYFVRFITGSDER